MAIGHSGAGPGSVSAVYHLVDRPVPCTIAAFVKCEAAGIPGRDRNTARATLGQGLAVSAFPRYVPV